MAYSPSPIRRDSVISQAAHEICRFIEEERLSPGQALPPETTNQSERLHARHQWNERRRFLRLETPGRGAS